MKDGGPAFPCPREVEVGELRSVYHDGMMLRDYFAAQALAGLLAGSFRNALQAPSLAPAAYEIANAMLAEREKSE